MFKIKLSYDGSRNAFEELARQFHGELHDSILYIRHSHINGTIVRIELEPGLTVHAINLNNEKEICFHWMDDIYTGKPTQNLFYYFTYFINPNIARVKFTNQPVEHRFQLDQINALLSNEHTAAIRFEKEQTLKGIIILIHENWLTGLWKEPLPFFLPTSISAREISLVKCIFEEAGNRHSLLLVKAKTNMLIHEMMQKTREAASHPLKFDAFKQLNQLIKVEAALLEGLKGKMIPIKQLAEMYHISESTLKRHFKRIFGKNIYEYYLWKKMELAMHYVRQGEMNVNEIATTLGYESVSHFINAFRKIHGKAPGEVIRELKG